MNAIQILLLATELLALVREVMATQGQDMEITALGAEHRAALEEARRVLQARREGNG